MLWLYFFFYLNRLSSCVLHCSLQKRHILNYQWGENPHIFPPFQLLIFGNFRVTCIRTSWLFCILFLFFLMYVANQHRDTSRLNKGLNDNSEQLIIQKKHKSVSEPWRIFLNVVVGWIKKMTPERKLSSTSSVLNQEFILSNFSDLEHHATNLSSFQF